MSQASLASSADAWPFALANCSRAFPSRSFSVADSTTLLPFGLATCATTDCRGVDLSLRFFVPPLLLLGGPNLRLPAILALEPHVLIPVPGRIRVVRRVLRQISTDCVVGNHRHLMLPPLFAAETRIPDRSRPRAFPPFFS